MPKQINNPGLPDGLTLTLPDLAEHMRGDALMYMAERGPDDCIGQWLWNLANRIAPPCIDDQPALDLQDDVAAPFQTHQVGD